MRQIKLIQDWNPVKIQDEVNRFLLEQPRIFHGKEDLAITTTVYDTAVYTTVMIVYETGLAPGFLRPFAEEPS